MEFILENENLRVTVESHGAELVSVVNKQTGAEMLWQADPAVWARHAPVLFPYCGRLKDGAFTCKGVRYEGGQHGFARDMEHTLRQQDADSVTLCLEANALTMKKFPFAFQFITTYTLEGNTVSHRVEVINDSDEVMPFGLGFHPAFLCPFEEGKATGDYVLRFDAPQSPVVVETGEKDGLVTGQRRPLFQNQTDIPLTDTLFAHDSICMTQLTARTLSLVEKATDRSVDVQIEGFPYVLVWSVPGPVKFVCIEPWHSLPDARDTDGRWEDKPAAARLNPGQRFATTLEMRFNR